MHPSGSWMRYFLFLFCCFIGSVSGRSHIHEDIGCGVFTLLLFHWFCFWEKGLEIRLCILVLHVCLFLDRRLVMCSVYFWRKGSEMRDVHFGTGPKVRIGWICWK